MGNRLRTFARNLFDVSSAGPRGLSMPLGFWAIILSGMGALLATVAVLQYRWTGEASSAEEIRIGAELESLMMEWNSDLYGELSAICIAMQVGPDSGARDTWNDYLERYVEWNYAAPQEALPNVYRNPDLVQDIYIWETSQSTEPRLFLLNIDTKKIEPSPIPDDIVALLERLRANSSSLSQALQAWRPLGLPLPQGQELQITAGSKSAGDYTTSGWQFDENVPAIVHPIFHRGRGQSLRSSSPVDWIVITLDMSVLQGRILPGLATRYFGGLEGLDYKVGVVRTGRSPQTIYSSDPGFGAKDVTVADSALNVFGPSSQRMVSNPATRPRIGQGLKGADWRSFSGPSWFPVIQYDLTPDPWVLELQHRSGPIQAVIYQVRQRNLIMSAFVLLLLAMNICVLTMAGLRAQRFARLQLDFVASISHELRTPLAAIFSAGENIKDGVVTENAGLRNYGTLIISQARQLMNHVDRILLFASMRSGKDRYNLRPIEVSEILRSVRNDTSALVKEESRFIDERVEPMVSRILGDPFAICGCLENLVTNAVKYGGTDRRIGITAALEWTASRGYEVAISVEDHGLGIKHSELKNIFEPFYRSPEAKAAQIHGTGLGLSLAKHLAEAMNGRLSVVSEVGVGSVFTLRLPAAPPEKNQPATVTPIRK